MGSSLECTSPAPTASAYATSANIPTWDSDPTQAWDDEPPMATNEMEGHASAAENTTNDAYYQEYGTVADG